MSEVSLVTEDSAVAVLMLGAGKILKGPSRHQYQARKDISFLNFPQCDKWAISGLRASCFTEMQIFQGLHYYFFIHILFSLEMPN